MSLSAFAERGYLNNFLFEKGIKNVRNYRRTDRGSDNERILEAESVFFDEVERLVRERGARLGMDSELVDFLAMNYTSMLITYSDKPPPVSLSMDQLIDELETRLSRTYGPDLEGRGLREQLNLMEKLL